MASKSKSAVSLERPVLAVDVVLFRIFAGDLQLALRRRDVEPFAAALALPGVALRIDETLIDAARRTVGEKLGIDCEKRHVFLDQLATFDALYRDPRGRTVSVVYLGILRDAERHPPEAIWKTVSSLSRGSLPFDHGLIVDTALSRLRGRVRYTNISREFLPDQFRIETLQGVYEAILGKNLNRTNLRTKLLKIGLIEQVSILSDAVGRQGGRPPHVYRFTDSELQALEHDYL